MKIIIDGKKIFVFLVLIMISIISFSVISNDLGEKENAATHSLSEIQRNGFSIDADENDFVDEVDFADSVDFIGIIGQLSCDFGEIMIGIDKETGAICSKLNELFESYGSNACTYNEESVYYSNPQVKGCDAATEELVEYKISPKVSGCTNKPTIYTNYICCNAALPKIYNPNIGNPNYNCEDGDKNEPDPEKIKSYTKLIAENITRDDICEDELNLIEYYCDNNKIESSRVQCNCENGACI
ncbi:hypothetical protein KY321_03625 [Candidatus Woesearchaeota archaeon]|nr:hypothetical protein [Candidatus Woesearchaeota archaeon]